MDIKLVITEYKKKTWGFIYEDGLLSEAHPFSETSSLGSIVTGRVTKIVKSIGAAFVDAGLGDTLYYYLPDSDGKHIFIKHGKTDKLCEGDEVLVQISREALGSKKTSCTADLNLRGEYVVVNRSGQVGISSKISSSEKKKELKDIFTELLSSGDFDANAGLIVRTSAANVDPEIIKKETITLLCKQREIISESKHAVVGKTLYEIKPSISEKAIDLLSKYAEDSTIQIQSDDEDVVRELEEADLTLLGKSTKISFFEDRMISLVSALNLDRDIEKLMARHIYLKSGGSIVVDPTEALLSIDVNSGKAIAGNSIQDKYLKINLEAAEMALRVVRFRNLSGIIIIDFINMKKTENEKTLSKKVKELCDRDYVQTKFIDVTPLGLCEITRQKVRVPVKF